MSPIDEAAEQFRMELAGYTAPKGAHRLQEQVPIDSQECDEAQLMTFRGSSTVYEHINVTRLVRESEDVMVLRLVEKVASRLALEAFRAGVRWQQQRVADVMGIELPTDK